MTKTVFLSSTATDLAEHRQAVYSAIQAMDGWKCVRMEDFGARNNTPDDFCRQQATTRDVFVGVVGHLYGSSAPGYDESFTEREHAAAAAHRPRLIFIASDDFPLPVSLREADEKRRKQQEFRRRLSAERIRESFHSTDDLALAVVTALRNWEKTSVAAQWETAPIAPTEPPGKIIERLNTQGFFARCGELPTDSRADDYIRLVAAPRSTNVLRLDQAAQEQFEETVERAFPETPTYSQDVARGQYYQFESQAQSRSSTHRVWRLWNSGAVGYSANLEQSNELPVGDLILHYIFFWRLIESVPGLRGEIVLDALLACPHARFAPFFPDPHGNRSNYDRIPGIRFDDRSQYVSEQTRSIKEIHLPVEDIVQELAELIHYQVQETATARIDFEKWLEALTNLIRQTGYSNWGKFR